MRQYDLTRWLEFSGIFWLGFNALVWWFTGSWFNLLVALLCLWALLLPPRGPLAFRMVYRLLMRAWANAPTCTLWRYEAREQAWFFKPLVWVGRMGGDSLRFVPTWICGLCVCTDDEVRYARRMLGGFHV